MQRAPAGATEWSARDFRSPAGARIQSSRRTGGLHHRLMSNVPSGQVAFFPALTLDMQCVLVGLRSKTSLNTYRRSAPSLPQDWRQFALQRAPCFGTFKSVRMIFASMALLAGLSVTSAQQQEDKLVDRILKPNMSLVNSAQKKKFDAAGTFVAKRAASKRYYALDNLLAQ